MVRPYQRRKAALQADEVNLIAVSLEPTCSPMRLPALPTRSFVSNTDVGSEEVLD
jgi:hypothetical protein